MKNKKKLKEEYPFIEIVVEAIYFKSRNIDNMAVLLTFNLQEQRYNIYIPRQPSATVVYKYQDRRMICHNCYQYGNTKIRR